MRLLSPIFNNLIRATQPTCQSPNIRPNLNSTTYIPRDIPDLANNKNFLEYITGLELKLICKRTKRLAVKEATESYLQVKENWKKNKLITLFNKTETLDAALIQISKKHPSNISIITEWIDSRFTYLFLKMEESTQNQGISRYRNHVYNSHQKAFKFYAILKALTTETITKELLLEAKIRPFIVWQEAIDILDHHKGEERDELAINKLSELSEYFNSLSQNVFQALIISFWAESKLRKITSLESKITLISDEIDNIYDQIENNTSIIQILKEKEISSKAEDSDQLSLNLIFFLRDKFTHRWMPPIKLDQYYMNFNDALQRRLEKILKIIPNKKNSLTKFFKELKDSYDAIHHPEEFLGRIDQIINTLEPIKNNHTLFDTEKEIIYNQTEETIEEYSTTCRDRAIIGLEKLEDLIAIIKHKKDALSLISIAASIYKRRIIWNHAQGKDTIENYLKLLCQFNEYIELGTRVHDMSFPKEAEDIGLYPIFKTIADTDINNFLNDIFELHPLLRHYILKLAGIEEPLISAQSQARRYKQLDEELSDKITGDERINMLTEWVYEEHKPLPKKELKPVQDLLFKTMRDNGYLKAPRNLRYNSFCEKLEITPSIIQALFTLRPEPKARYLYRLLQSIDRYCSQENIEGLWL